MAAGLPGNRSTFQRGCALRGKSKILKGAQMKTNKIFQSRIADLLIRGFLSIVILSLSLFMAPGMTHALTPVAVAWDANNPEPEGYILSWGTTSGNYPNSKDVGNVTEYTIADLQEGVTYYFAAKAYDDAGNESAYSVEISHTVGLVTHTIDATAAANGSITPGGSVVVNDGASQTFTIVPEQDYQVLEVRVDGTLIGTATSHTFNNVTQDHTITASY